MWEQGLPAMKATQFLRDRIACIAGKPCSHPFRSHLNPLAIKVTKKSGVIWGKAAATPNHPPSPAPLR